MTRRGSATGVNRYVLVILSIMFLLLTKIFTEIAMSEESSKSKFNFIEIAAILLFVIGIIMIFVSRNGVPERDRELRNAVRYQDVSELADAMWLLSSNSPDFVAEIRTHVSEYATCNENSKGASTLESFLVPDYFETLPQDPGGEEYRFVVDTKNRITVCTLAGEDENSQSKKISITR